MSFRSQDRAAGRHTLVHVFASVQRNLAVGSPSHGFWSTDQCSHVPQKNLRSTNAGVRDGGPAQALEERAASVLNSLSQSTILPRLATKLSLFCRDHICFRNCLAARLPERGGARRPRLPRDGFMSQIHRERGRGGGQHKL